MKESVNVDFRGKLGCDGEREREEEDEEEEQLSALAHFPFDGILLFFSVVLKTKLTLSATMCEVFHLSFNLFSFLSLFPPLLFLFHFRILPLPSLNEIYIFDRHNKNSGTFTSFMRNFFFVISFCTLSISLTFPSFSSLSLSFLRHGKAESILLYI